MNRTEAYFAPATKYTLKNKEIADDLIPDHKWSKNEKKILKQFPYKTLRAKPHHLISEAKEANHSLYESVNREINNGENDSIILLPDKNNAEKWRLKPLTEENTANESIFSELPKRSIIDIMMFVDQQIHFTHQFDSILPKSAKHSDDPTYIIAGILASALGVSTSEMGELSDLNQHTLLSAYLHDFDQGIASNRSWICMIAIKELHQIDQNPSIFAMG